MTNLGQHTAGSPAWSRAMKIAALGLCVGLFGTLPAHAQEKGKLGFVVKDWFSYMYTTKFMDECPEGLTLTNDELWWRGLSKEQRAKQTGNGLVQALARAGQAMNRGPNGEDVCFNPTIVKDPPALPDERYSTCRFGVVSPEPPHPRHYWLHAAVEVALGKLVTETFRGP